MALAIVLGIAGGILGFIPLVIGLKMVKRHPQEGNLGPMMKLFLGILASFVILVAFAVIFVAVDKADSIPFVLAEAITLMITAIAFGIRSQRQEKKK